MSARGTVSILTDDKAGLLQSEYIQQYLADWGEDVNEWVMLDDVNWFKADNVIQQAPNVSWIAFADKYCETYNEVFIYVSTQTAAQLDIPSGLHKILHIDEEPVLAVDNLTEDQRVYSIYQRLMAHIKKED